MVKDTIVGMLEKVLTDLRRTGDIEASAIVSRDGLLMASDIAEGIHAETFAAMSATMLGAAETAISELNKGIPDRVIVESKKGKVITTGAGPKALLVVMTPPEAGLGLILVEMEKAADKAKKLL
ncbi:MAG: roadblock/LC7 domain-containing protein [Methanosarcinales archaeon]|nr:MAG: roadblock/LC7 domain-containing protein [Methanosarcinales archaeon]